jgi:hypothetical protein
MVHWNEMDEIIKGFYKKNGTIFGGKIKLPTPYPSSMNKIGKKLGQISQVFPP